MSTVTLLHQEGTHRRISTRSLQGWNVFLRVLQAALETGYSIKEHIRARFHILSRDWQGFFESFGVLSKISFVVYPGNIGMERRVPLTRHQGNEWGNIRLP